MMLQFLHTKVCVDQSILGCVCEGMCKVHVQPGYLGFYVSTRHGYSVHEANGILWAVLGMPSSSEMQWDMTWDAGKGVAG